MRDDLSDPSIFPVRERRTPHDGRPSMNGTSTLIEGGSNSIVEMYENTSDMNHHHHQHHHAVSSLRVRVGCHPGGHRGKGRFERRLTRAEKSSEPNQPS